MPCCSGSGEILIVPRNGGPGTNAEPYEGRPPLPQDVVSSWEEFVNTAAEEDPGVRERANQLSTHPYVAWVEEESLEPQVRRLRYDPRVLCATRNWRTSLATIA